MNQLLSIVKAVRIPKPVWKSRGGLAECWIRKGIYKVVREFDETRYLIETDSGLTLVQKSLTEPIN